MSHEKRPQCDHNASKYTYKVSVDIDFPSLFKYFMIFSAENSLPVVSTTYCSSKLNKTISFSPNLSTTSLSIIESNTL